MEVTGKARLKLWLLALPWRAEALREVPGKWPLLCRFFWKREVAGKCLGSGAEVPQEVAFLDPGAPLDHPPLYREVTVPTSFLPAILALPTTTCRHVTPASRRPITFGTSR